jgi:ribosome-associated protein
MAKDPGELHYPQIKGELSFESTRSRGPGGQHVNRTESAVILRWNLSETKGFTDLQKGRMLEKIGNQLTKEGEVLIRAETFRDQESNKKEAVRRLNELIEKALFVPKKRIKTKPTKSSQRKRLDNKKSHSMTKKLRSEKW